MTLFSTFGLFIALSLLIALVLAVIVITPWLRASRLRENPVDNQLLDINISVFRERLTELQSDKDNGTIDDASARAAMDMLKVDPEGFDELDRRMLGIIIDAFDGGPVGVESLAAALSEERGTLEDVIEPYLIQQGYLIRTARGRMATPKAYRHLGLEKERGSE